MTDARWSRACEMLAPETRADLEQSVGRPCKDALPGENVPTPSGPPRIKVFGTTAQLRYDGETMFLTRFGDGWRLLALACTPHGPRPYDCQIQGG